MAALDGRIRSMASTHELLSNRQWRGISMAELLRREFAPYAASNNTKIGGPEVMLSAEAGQAMAMVLHELVTNAAKHGALSDAGRPGIGSVVPEAERGRAVGSSNGRKPADHGSKLQRNLAMARE